MLRKFRVNLSTLLVLVVIVSMIALMACSEIGCASKKVHVVNAPTGTNVSEVAAWYSATGAIHTVALTTEATSAALIQVHAMQVNGKPAIPDDAYQNALLVVGKVAQAGIRIDAILRNSPNTFNAGTKAQVVALLSDATKQLQAADLNGLFSRSQTPQAQAALTQVQLLQSTLNFLLQ